jgi:hypothetical protein
MFAQSLEQIPAHGSDPLGNNEIVVEGICDVLGLQVFGQNIFAGSGVDCLALQHFLTRKNLPIDRRLEPHDLAGSEIAVFLCLDQRVFVHRFAKVREVVSGDFRIVRRLLLGLAQLARGGGEADMNGVRVTLEHFGPTPPCRAVALIDNDDGEGIFRVMIGEETGVVVICVIEAERLVRGNVHLGILRGILSTFGLDDAHAAFRKSFREFVPGLFAQFVAVAKEKRGLRQPPSLMHSPQEICGNHGFSCAGGQAKQHADPFIPLLTTKHLLEGCTDRGILIITRLGKGDAVRHE